MSQEPFLWIFWKYKIEGSTKRDINTWRHCRSSSKKQSSFRWLLTKGYREATRWTTFISQENQCLLTFRMWYFNTWGNNRQLSQLFIVYNFIQNIIKKVALALFFSYVPTTRTKSRFPLQSTLPFYSRFLELSDFSNQFFFSLESLKNLDSTA